MFLPNFRTSIRSSVKSKLCPTVPKTMTMRRNRKSSFRQFCDQFAGLQNESKCRFQVVPPKFRSTYATKCTLLQQFLCCVSAASLVALPPAVPTMSRIVDKPILDTVFFQNVLQKYERSGSLIICDVRVESGTSPGDNYMSEVLRVYATGYTPKICSKFEFFYYI